MKKSYLIPIIIVVLIILFLMIFRFGGEDSWIKDGRGVWIKHGNPSKTPEYVLEQQEAINCSLDLFWKDKLSSIKLNSPCLGTCGDYAVDIVHVPRTTEDDLAENQCEDYRNGNVSHFIELDKDGGIVRVV